MNLNEEMEEHLIGSVVTGNKPWNHSYNVGLVVAQSYSEERSSAIKVMWMNSKFKEKFDFFLGVEGIKGRYVYTWEHPTSVNVLSRNEYHG